jgi:hypothetical protein
MKKNGLRQIIGERVFFFANVPLSLCGILCVKISQNICSLLSSSWFFSRTDRLDFYFFSQIVGREGKKSSTTRGLV